ncbi:4'-phosphopantetheinyl transferase family protein [Rathayibacter tritici]|uniref:4'-phosphopantetheinyl transferase family protein n=1 Tax=Rathayibacter tritici TaxID=33888 RepID=UPI001AD848BC|nr:4'-phosphopantetheinyl transferase superfamily protein [Rathayibacter tritici]
MTTAHPGLFSGLLPNSVVVAESSDDEGARPLWPEEAAVIDRAVEKRRREFATVRSLARGCLGRLGVAPAPILPDADRAPRWPAGIVGSMTHCDGMRAAAVARVGSVVGIGIDAEPDQPLPDGLLDFVSVPLERGPLAALAVRRPDVSWDRLLFSAKESVFKTWFPVTRRWLDFSDCAVEFDPNRGTFLATLLVPDGDAMQTMSGRWASSSVAGRALLGTAITVS